MNRRTQAETALLAGLGGFFLGGLFNVSKEIIEIMTGAVVGGAIVFFASFFIMGLIFDIKDEHATFISEVDDFVPAKMKRDNDSKKGKKIDIVIKD